MSVRFNASGEKLTRTANLPGNLRGVTLCGWFRLVTDTNGYACLLNISKTTSQYVYLETDSNGTSLKVWHTSASASMLSLTANTWYFLALTTSSSGTVTGYYAALGTSTLSSASPTGTAADQAPDLIAFGDSCWTGERFDGNAFALKVWSAELTQAELEREMQTVRPQRTANLHSWLPCLPGSGERARDYSGNGYNYTEGGTLSDEDHPPIPWGAPILWQPATVAAPSGITATGIASTEAIGSPTVSGEIVPTGIASITAIGSHTVSGAIAPTGFDSITAVGSPTLQAVTSGNIDPTGIASITAIGSPALAGTVSPTGIASGEAIGSPALAQNVTLIWLTGFEHGLAAPVTSGGGLWDLVSGSPTVDSTSPHSGTYSLRLNPSAADMYVNRNIPGSHTILVGSFYVRFNSSLPGADCRYIGVYPASGSQLYIGFKQSTSKLTCYFNGGTVQSSGDTVIANQWYRVDFRADISANAYTCDWQMDGVAQTQATRTSTASTWDSFGLGQDAGQTYDLRIDDALLSASSVDYPIGPHIVTGLRPNADGTHNNAANIMEDSSGNDIDGVTYYAYDKLDEDPWTTTANADYVRQTGNGTGNYCEVLFANTTDTNIIGAGALLQYASATTTSNTGGCVIIDEDGTSTTLWGASGSLADYSETSAFYKFAILPTPAGEWDQAAVNALKCRFGYSGDADPDPYWLALIIEVATDSTTITATGIDSVTEIGSPALSGAIVPTGIDSTTAFGTISLSSIILPTGIGNTSTIGSPTIYGSVAPTGIASVTAIGTPTLAGFIVPTGIASGEAIGSPTLTTPTPGGISPTGIASTEAIGSPSLAPSIAPTGIANTSEFGLLLLTGFLPVTSIASTTAAGSPILYEETSLTTIQAAWNNRTMPLFRLIFSGTSGRLTVDQDRLLLYEEKQTGRLGRTECTIILNNNDGALTADVTGSLVPRREFALFIGARVAGVDYLARRHTFTILDILPVNFKNATNALQLRCENYWDKFRRPATDNLAWTDETIGDILDDIASSVGVTIERDASAFWAYTVDQWQAPAGLPPQPVIADLVGDGQRTHAIAVARFDPEGIWQVEGISTNPATDYTLSNTANQYDSDIGTHGDVGTRFQVTGSATQESASADDLETAIGEQRIHIVNAYALPAAYVHARVVQEAVEQRERYTRGTLKMRPDTRLQLWHVVTLAGVANVNPATQFRVTSIYFKYAPSVFDMQIGLRAVATDNNVTIIEPIPIVPPPEDSVRPELPPPVTPAPPPRPVLPKDSNIIDDFDAVDDIDNWTFYNGTWAIATDLSTTDLDIEYALGQTDTTAIRSCAIRMGNYSADNYFTGGLYLGAAGACGLMAFAIDDDNGYEIKIDSDADTVSLIRWIAGNPYTLDTHSMTIDTTTGYFVGIERHGKHLRVYCKDADEHTKPVFSAANLTANIADTCFLSGRIGFTSYGVNSRFFTARAGVTPVHNHGEHAHTTKPHGHRHCTGSAWTSPTGSAERGAWNTETITHTELARKIKALIDDLKNDHLIHD